MPHRIIKRGLAGLLAIVWTLAVLVPFAYASSADFVARVQLDPTKDWTQTLALPIRPRDLIRVGALDTRTGGFASGVTLELHGPFDTVSFPSNGDYLTPPFGGDYTLIARGYGREDRAFFTVAGEEIDPYGRGGVLGVNFMEAWEQWDHPSLYEEGLAALLDLGVAATRFSFHWDYLERDPDLYLNDPGIWDLYDRAILDLKERGVEIVGLITGTPCWARDWGGEECPDAYNQGTRLPTADKVVNGRRVAWYYQRFIQAIALRYNGRTVVNGVVLPEVRFFEYWNEPNGCGLYGCRSKSSEERREYIRWLKRTRNALVAANPNARLSIGGLDGTARREWLDFIYQYIKDRREDPDDYFDAVALHPYDWDGIVNIDRLFEFRQSMMDSGNFARGVGDDREKAIWITEYGWTLSPTSGHAVTEDRQAERLVRALNLFASGRLGFLQFSTYHLLYDTPICEPNEMMGLITYDSCPDPVPILRKAYYALRDFAVEPEITLSPEEPRVGGRLEVRVRHVLGLDNAVLYLHGLVDDGTEMADVYPLQNRRTELDENGILWTVWGRGPVVKNPSFEFDAAGHGLPSFWHRSPGTPRNIEFLVTDERATNGTRSLMVETAPTGSDSHYYQGIWQSTTSPGSDTSLVFSCDLYVVRGVVVINLYTFDPFPRVVWLGYAVVEEGHRFERVEIPFETLKPERYDQIHYRIDGIQPRDSSATTVFYVDNVALKGLD